MIFYIRKKSKLTFCLIYNDYILWGLFSKSTDMQTFCLVDSLNGNLVDSLNGKHANQIPKEDRVFFLETAIIPKNHRQCAL